MISNFGRFDKEKGTLRLLIAIYSVCASVRKGLLKDVLRGEEVGGTAFESSLDTLKDLGLIEDRKKTIEGKRMIFCYFTEKGRIIAEKLYEIQTILNKD